MSDKMKVPVKDSDIVNDICLCIYTMLLAQRLGRLPHVDDLNPVAQAALGKKLFQFLDYRDAHQLNISDEDVYLGCLEDHGVTPNPNYPSVRGANALVRSRRLAEEGGER